MKNAKRNYIFVSLIFTLSEAQNTTIIVGNANQLSIVVFKLSKNSKKCVSIPNLRLSCGFIKRGSLSGLKCKFSLRNPLQKQFQNPWKRVISRD